MLRTRVTVFGAFTAGFLALGCGDDSGGGSGGTRGRGTPACQDWQDALCDFAADECGLAPRDFCDTQYLGIECLSDDKASACSSAFQAASCGAPPPNCDFADIADPAPAMAKCETFFRTVCELEMRCGGIRPVDQCVTEVMAMKGDCSNALSVDLRYEDCMDSLKSTSCANATSAINVCAGVIRATMSPVGGAGASGQSASGSGGTIGGVGGSGSGDFGGAGSWRRRFRWCGWRGLRRGEAHECAACAMDSKFDSPVYARVPMTEESPERRSSGERAGIPDRNS